MHSQQALIRDSFIQTTVFIERGLSSKGHGLMLLQIAIFTQEQEIRSEASASN